MAKLSASNLGRSALLFFAALIPSACSQKYPSDWPAPAPSNAGLAGQKCPLVAGDFVEEGSSKEENVPLLDVFRESVETPRYARRVTIEQFGDDSLIVAVFEPVTGDTGHAAVGERRVLRRADGNFSCKPGEMRVSYTDWVGVDNIVGVLRARSRVRRAVDGTLVVQRRETVAAIALMLPIVLTRQYWIQYRPWPEAAR